MVEANIGDSEMIMMPTPTVAAAARIEMVAQVGRVKQWCEQTLARLNVPGGSAGECEIARRAAVAAWGLLHVGHGW